MIEKSLNPEANPVASGYSLDAYCKWSNPYHSFQEFPHSFYGNTKADCKKQARRRGWQLHHDGYATCPKCAAKPKGKPE